MRNKRRIIQLLYISVFLVIFTSGIHSQKKTDSVPAFRQDLSSFSSEDLRISAAKAIYTPEAVPYLEALLQKGVKENSSSTIEEALSSLLKHYYADFDLQNLNYWIHFTDSLVKEGKVNTNLYYDGHRNRASLLLEKKEYEQSVNETIALYNEAEKNNDNYGIVCSSEQLGNIYLSNQQDSAAVEAYQNAYNRLKNMKQYFDYQARLVSCLLESHLRLNNIDTVELLLEEFKKLLVLQENELRSERGGTTTTNWYRWQLNSFYVDLYLRKNEMDKALESLNKSSAYYEEGMTASSDFSVFYYLYVKASYLKKNKKYLEALNTVDFILSDFQEPPCLKLRIDILCEMGNFKDALFSYNDLLEVIQKRNNEDFVRKVNNLQALSDKNDQQIKQKELQLVVLETETKHRQFIFIVLVSLIVVILIFFLARSLRHTFRLKNELENDKNSLTISREKLKEEQTKAENANQMKDAFIANISHEIRTPLNTIVGFSTLLSDMQLEENEKRTFVGLIEKNSSLLLDLVNDVLDLSRLESGRTKITIAPCELTHCCQKLLESTSKDLVPGVKLTFSPSVTPFILETDSRLLSQLLDNLLSNAAKFTKQGEINLAYEADDTKRQVVFSVTDTGPGIPHDKQEVIFDRFEKLNEYTQGSGLGLSLCQAIAQKLGGFNMIDTTYKAGARFIFIHPYDSKL